MGMNTDLMVYCFASPEQRTYEAVYAALRYWWGNYNKKHGHLSCRDQYPPSGWQLTDLVGSQWINVHTCTIQQMQSTEIDRWGNTAPVGFGRGFWWYQRFVMDDDIRWDVLTPDEQFTWHVARVSYRQKHLATAEAQYELMKNDSMNASSKKHSWKTAQKELYQAIDILQAFARLNGFAVGTEELNAGLVSADDQPVQMRLF
jgi:hypothetical protein